MQICFLSSSSIVVFMDLAFCLPPPQQSSRIEALASLLITFPSPPPWIPHHQAPNSHLFSELLLQNLTSSLPPHPYPHKCEYHTAQLVRDFLVAQTINSLPTIRETWVWSLGRKDPLEKRMATHSSILAWRIPWTEESGELPSMGSQELDTKEKKIRVRHDWVTHTHTSWWGPSDHSRSLNLPYTPSPAQWSFPLFSGQLLLLTPTGK